LSTFIRRADGSVGHAQLFVRIVIALAVALLSLPLMSTSAFAEGEADGTPTEQTTEQTTDPATDPPPTEPAADEPAAVEPPATEEPAPAPKEEAPAPATEEPATEAPAPEEAAAEEPVKATTSKTVTQATADADAAPTASGDCAASFDQNTQENRGGSWINGALNQNNSNYAEGDYVPQRVELTGLATGTHTLTFSYDRTKNGKYAYDFVDHLGISGSAGASVSWDAATPNPPMPFAETVFVTITFTVVANDATATMIWDGHIASELDYGPNTGAGSISGAPYHFSLVDMSCGNVGQQDNQLMADAVDFGKLTIVKDAQPNDPQDFSFTLDAPNDLHTAFKLDDDSDGTLPSSVTYNVPPGATTATEVNIPGGWTLTDITCTKAGTEVGSSVTVTLADDEQVTCTFTNKVIAPELTLVKDVDHNGTVDTATPDEWTLTAASPDDSVSGPGAGGGQVVDAEVLVGTYELTEDTDHAGYELVKWECDGATVEHVGDVWQVDIDLADDVTCTAFNRAIRSSWMVEKSSVPQSGSTVEPGDEIDYTITVTKVGDGVNVGDFDVTDTFTGVDRSWISDISGGGVLGASTIVWHIDEVSDQLTLTYTVTVGADAWNRTLHNVVTPGPTPCIDTNPDPLIDCDETTHFTPHFALDKDVELLNGDVVPGDGDNHAEPGELLEYSLTVVNDSNGDLDDAVVTDNLTDVLLYADMVSTDAELAAQGLSLSGSTLTLTFDLDAGESLTVRYTVEIKDGTWGVTLHNVATPEPGGPGECIPPGDVPGDGEDDLTECTTDTPTPPVTSQPVKKIDDETGEVLEGATFQLWSHSGCTEPGAVGTAEDLIGPDDVLLDTQVTGADGELVFEDLQHGCYLLVESAPPPFYDLPADNAMEILITEDEIINGVPQDTLEITDFAEGQLAIVAKRQYELIDSEWVPSDGEIEYGDVVKYQVEVAATGPKNFHDVVVTDYVPGFNPDDEVSTLDAILDEASIACVGTIPCTTSVDPATQLVTWDLGDLEPGAGETIGTIAEMVVRFPERAAIVAPGVTITDTLWNVGYLRWIELAPGPITDAPARAVEIPKELISNEVVITAKYSQPPLEIKDCTTNPEMKKCKKLPDTGAPAHLVQLAGLGALVLGLGLALVTRRRKEEDQA